jgi:hypothetical protein
MPAFDEPALAWIRDKPWSIRHRRAIFAAKETPAAKGEIMPQNRWVWTLGGCVAGLLLAGCASGPGDSSRTGSTLQAKATTQPAPASAPATQSAPPLNQLVPEPEARNASASRRSVDGLNRAHWPTVTFRAGAGYTVHYPVYFDRTPPASDPNAQAVLDQPTQPRRVAAALSGNRPGNWACANWKREGAELLLFAWDTATWPVSAIKQPPWELTTTPPRPATVDQREPHPATQPSTAPATRPAATPWNASP